MKQNDAQDKIIGIVSYIDTVQIWFPRRLKRYELDTIESLCMGKRMCPYYKRMKCHNKWECRHILQIPKNEIFDYLHKTFGDEILINKVQIALDYITKDFLDAEEIKMFFNHHLVHPWHGKQKIIRYKKTTYTAERGSKRNYVKYADKPSKITKTPCFHLEFRLFSKGTIENAGLSNLINLGSINYRDFWMKYLLLQEIDIVKLGKRFTDRSNWKKPWIKEYIPGKPFDNFQRIGNTILRSCAQSEEGGTVQELKDRFRGKKLNVNKCLKKIDSDPFLPNA